MRGRRVTKSAATAILAAYVAEENAAALENAERTRRIGLLLGGEHDGAPARLTREELGQCMLTAIGRLNRATRRALGHRGDGHLHPLVTTKAVPRGRP